MKVKNLFILAAMYCCQAFSLHAQEKKIVDASTEFFQQPSTAKLSNNGKYYAFRTFRTKEERDKGAAEFEIGSTDKKWRRIFLNGKDNYGQSLNFSGDNRYAVFLIRTDSLIVFDLETKKQVSIANVGDFKMNSEDHAQYCAYQVKGHRGELSLYQLTTGKTQHFVGVQEYLFNPKGNNLFLFQQSNGQKQELTLVDIEKGTSRKLWQGYQPSGFYLDKSTDQLAFLSADSSQLNQPVSIWKYGSGQYKAALCFDMRNDTLKTNWQISGIRGMTANSDLLIRMNTQNKSTKPVKGVNIWSYFDPKLQSEQLRQSDQETIYDFVLTTNGNRMIRLNFENEQFLPQLNTNNGLIFKMGPGSSSEWYWNKSSAFSCYLISFKDGTRKSVVSNVPNIMENFFHISPKGKYTIYYDPSKLSYCCYNNLTGETADITKDLPAVWTSTEGDDTKKNACDPVGIMGWLKNDENVLLYDRQHIILADPAGKVPAINLTKDFTKGKNLIFRSAFDGINTMEKPLAWNDQIILRVFDDSNKNDGFYSLRLKKENSQLDSLSLQPYMFDSGGQGRPVKALNGSMYIVTREKANEFPNYYLSRNLKTFKSLTDSQPQRAYNWLTSELVTWRNFNGTMSQGILYKPENFDAQKKYPIIFFYYERFSETLHKFIHPHSDAAGGTIDIPTFVSNGYLVFVPDIHYPMNIGQGPGVYNSVVSAAKYLSKFSFVDSTKMGINGHSRGGFQTNYLVTHTDIFAAAISGSGYSDQISHAFSTRSTTSGQSRMSGQEIGPQRIGATLWERPDLYIANSPVFQANMAFTPILMMSNDQDSDVPFEQGMEFFLALRRLGKKAWLLQYEGENHVLLDVKNVNDLNFRMQQFFDHYLKGAPAPQWMVYGIPASKKGIDNGYDLAPKGVEPGPGLTRNH